MSSSSNPQRFGLKLDIGSTPDGTGTGGSILIAEDSKTLKTGGFPQNYTFSFPIFSLSTFIANKGTFWIDADSGSVTVRAKSILIVRTGSGEN